MRRPRRVTWPELLEEISQKVASLPINCREIAIQDKAAIFDLMRYYTAQPEDFRQYVYLKKSGYTKNLVRELPNNVGNIIIMCWAPSQMSGIHAHEGSRCFVKVLSGLLKEERYSHPANKPEGVSLFGETVLIRGSTWRENDVAYIDDSMGCHRVTNLSSRQPAVTMHVYVPPYRKSRLFEPDQMTNRITLERSCVLDVTFDLARAKPRLAATSAPQREAEEEAEPDKSQAAAAEAAAPAAEAAVESKRAVEAETNSDSEPKQASEPKLNTVAAKPRQVDREAGEESS